VDPDTYQRLAARTECDQEKVARRMAGPYPADPESLGVSTLLPVRVNHGVLGLAGEVGELAAAVERWLYYGHELAPAPGVRRPAAGPGRSLRR
jgi:hypothetical protein